MVALLAILSFVLGFSVCFIVIFVYGVYKINERTNNALAKVIEENQKNGVL